MYRRAISYTLYFFEMKNLLAILFLLLSFFYKAQQKVSFEELNSQNVLQAFGGAGIGNSAGFMQVLQIGNGNDIKIYDKNPKQVSISQIGNENQTLYINTSNTPSAATINTKGNSNYVDMVGSNSISENMKININNSNMIIFIRNY